MSEAEKPSSNSTLVEIPHGHSSAHAEDGEGNWLVSYADMMTLLVGFFVILLSFSTIDQEKLEGVRKELTKQFGGTYHVPYGDLADRIRDAISKLGLGDQFVIKNNDLGVEISFLGTVFFNLGSADVKAEAKTLLDQLAPVLKSESADFNIVIEGHTDDVPVSGGVEFHNNWELSSLRACRVLEMFVARGFNPLKLTAVGYGDTRPIVPNREADGAAIARNQAQNRRVVVKVLKHGEATIGVEAPKESE